MRRVWGAASLAASVVLIAACLTAAAGAGAAPDPAPTGPPSPSPAGVPATAPTAAPSLTLTAAPGTVTSGDLSRLTVRLGVAGAAVRLSRRAAGASGFTPVAELTTGSAGSATYSALPRATSAYRVEFAGDDQWLPASAETTVTVRPLVQLWATGSVYRGERVRLSLKVGPPRAGASVSIETLRDDGWAVWRTVKLNADSRAVTYWRSDRAGRRAFRVVVPADDGHAAGTSSVQRVTVLPPNPYHVPVGAKRIVVVDKSQYRLYFFSYGREVKSFPCVLGRPGLPTPTGHFKIYAKGMWPGGPFGARIMSYHSPYAIHGTNEPHLLSRFPRNFSHGCTRLHNANAVWLYDHAPVGTPVWNVP